MANKICLSEKELTERVGKQCELEFKRLTDNLFNKISDKYEEMVKEQTKSEIDKVNESITSQCPSHGALVIVLDKNEIHVPFYPLSKVSITGYSHKDQEKTLELDWEYLTEDKVKDITEFMATYDLVKLKTVTARDVEIYDKEAFEKDGQIVKNTKHYFNNFVAYCSVNDIRGIYLINAQLD